MQRAILYLPGMAQHIFDQSAGLVADRIARSLQGKLGIDTPFLYRITIKSDVHRFEGIPIDIASVEIIRGDATGDVKEKTWEKLIDIVELRYLPRFTKSFSDLSPPARAFRAVWMITSGLPKYIRMLKDGGLRKAQVSYLNYVAIFSIIAFIYWMLVAVTAFVGIPKIIDINATQNARTSMVATLSAILTLLTLVFLALKKPVESYDKQAVEYYSSMTYYSDNRRFLCVLNAILDTIVYLRAHGYEKVDLLSFSFGTVLASDTIYPKIHEDDQRLKHLDTWRPTPKIENWITIGYPYDIIEQLHPGYFANRQESKLLVSSKWINVLVENDYLASELGNKHGVKSVGRAKLGCYPNEEMHSPDEEVKFKPDHKVKLSDVFWRHRDVNHRLYWNAEDASERTCFAEIVDKAGWMNDVKPA